MHPAEDYVAVDSKGRRIAGPFRYYEEARLRATKAGGYVVFAAEPHAAEARAGIHTHGPPPEGTVVVAAPERKRDRPLGPLADPTVSIPPLWWIEYEGENGTTEAFIWADSEKKAVDRLREVVPTVERINWVKHLRRDQVLLKPGRNIYAGEARDCAGSEMQRAESAAQQAAEGCGCAECKSGKACSCGTKPERVVAQRQVIETVAVAGETARVLYEERRRPGKSEKPLRWHRKGDDLVSTGALGSYIISRRKPDRRRGQLPIVLGKDGFPLKDFDTVAQAKTFAQFYEEIAPSLMATPGPASSKIPAQSCGPFAQVQRDPEAFNRCRTMAEAIGPIDSIEDVWALLAPELSKYATESIIVVPLGHHGELVEVPIEVHRGQKSSVGADPAEILRDVLITGASSFWIAHPHPSGKSAKPSPADMNLTKIVARSTEILGGKSGRVEGTLKFEGHAVITAKEVGDASTGKVKKMS